MKTSLVGVAAVLGAALAGPVASAEYPEKPVRFIVPYAPGGGTDLISRLIAQKMGDVLGKQVITENRAGGAGNIGTEYVARAAPDGYTFLFAGLSNAVNVAIFAKLPFNLFTDLEPVSLFSHVPLMLVVHPSFPARSVPELIALAKQPGSNLNYGSGGIGTANHVAGELFKYMANVKIDHIPYKGGGPALADLAGNHVNMVFATMTATFEMVKAGRIRALATTSLKRPPSAPDYPTVAETVPNFEVSGWYGVMAPAGTPKAIVNRWSAELAKIARDPEVVASLRAQGTETIGNTPEEFGKFLRAEVDKWVAVSKASGLSAK